MLKNYQNEMKEDLFADWFIAVNVADVFDFRFADHVLCGSRRYGQYPQIAACQHLSFITIRFIEFDN